MTIELLKPSEAAVLLRTSPGYLAQMRLNGKGPRFKKLGTKVLYERKAIEEWLTAQSEYTSTSEY